MDTISARFDTWCTIIWFVVVLLFLLRLRIFSLVASVYCLECDGFALLNPYINYFTYREVKHMFLLLNSEPDVFEIFPKHSGVLHSFNMGHSFFFPFYENHKIIKATPSGNIGITFALALFLPLFSLVDHFSKLPTDNNIF